jgi:hypothetical protein
MLKSHYLFLGFFIFLTNSEQNFAAEKKPAPAPETKKATEIEITQSMNIIETAEKQFNEATRLLHEYAQEKKVVKAAAESIDRSLAKAEEISASLNEIKL